MATHSFKSTYAKSSPWNHWWRHCDVIFQSISTKSCLLVCNTKKHPLCKIWAKSDKKQRSCKKWEMKSLDVISKNGSTIFSVSVLFSHTYWCTKFQVDWRSDKRITRGGAKDPQDWEWSKKPGQDRVNKVTEHSNPIFASLEFLKLKTFVNSVTLICIWMPEQNSTSLFSWLFCLMLTNSSFNTKLTSCGDLFLEKKNIPIWNKVNWK